MISPNSTAQPPSILALHCASIATASLTGVMERTLKLDMVEVRDLRLHRGDDELSVFDPLVTYLLLVAIVQLIKVPLSCHELLPEIHIKAGESASSLFQTISFLLLLLLLFFYLFFLLL